MRFSGELPSGIWVEMKIVLLNGRANIQPYICLKAGTG